MRKHRLFGVVIATALGTGLIAQQPAPAHHLSAINLSTRGADTGSTPAPLGTLANKAVPHPGDTVVALTSLLAPPPPPPTTTTTAPPVTTTTTAPPVTTTTAAPVTTTTAAPVTTTTAAPAPAATTVSAGGPTPQQWLELRNCESGDNYADNTGNGYYGAYQFSEATWQSLGYSGLPSNAPPAVQDQAARTLQARYGWAQWPECSRQLGFT